jgi:hypothetical protein
MAESITISVPKRMPITERISELGRQLSDWLHSLNEPLNFWRDKLELTKCEAKGSEYIYQYAIRRGVRAY